MDEKNEQRNSLAWAAGLLSMNGSFAVVKAGDKQFVRMTVQSSVHHQAVKDFAEIFALNATVAGKATRVAVQGKRLHKIMTDVWPNLSVDQKKRYRAARQEMKSRVDG